MATSNSQNYAISATEIISEATELCGGAAGSDGTIPTADYNSALRTLNLMIKAWQQEGLFLHKYGTATLFFAHEAGHYLLGTTAHATESYVETTLAADAALGATTITLTSTDGITALDVIGIVLDDGTIHWTTVTTAATTLIASGLASAASSGNMVIAYTTAIGIPEKVTDVMRQNADAIDTEVEIISREAYRRISDKEAVGKTTKVFIDPKTTYVGLYAWPMPDDVTDRLTFSYAKLVDDFDNTTDNPDIPIGFAEALVTGLAYRLAPKYRLPASEREDLRLRAENAKAAIDDFEETSLFFEPRMS